jgi:serine/threonine protein kinase
MGNITKNKPKFPKSLNQSVRNLLTKMLDKSPDTRYNIIQVLQHPWVQNFIPYRATIS